MTMNKRAVLQYALLVVCTSAFGHPVSAQQERLHPAAIGQIVDEVLLRVLPPSERLSRVTIAKRKLSFDHERTAAAFGYPGASISVSDLRLRSAVGPGSRTMLSDCDQMRRQQCSLLGWRAYVWIEPVSVTKSQAVVRAHVSWTDRDPKTFEERVPPKTRGFLVGMVRQLELTRLPNGNWKFVKEGPAAAGG